MFSKLIILFENLFVASDLPDADEDAGFHGEIFGNSLNFKKQLVCMHMHIMVSKNDYQVMIYTYPAKLFSTTILVFYA